MSHAATPAGRLGLTVLLGVLPAASQGETIYQCVRNGIVTFTQTAPDSGCQPLDVRPYVPDPEVATRRKDELNTWRDSRSQALAEARRKKSRQQNKTTDVETRGRIDPGAATPLLPLDLNLNPVQRTDQ